MLVHVLIFLAGLFVGATIGVLVLGIFVGSSGSWPDPGR